MKTEMTDSHVKVKRGKSFSEEKFILVAAFEVQPKGNKLSAAFKVKSWERRSLYCPLLVGCRTH